LLDNTLMGLQANRPVTHLAFGYVRQLSAGGYDGGSHDERSSWSKIARSCAPIRTGRLRETRDLATIFFRYLLIATHVPLHAPASSLPFSQPPFLSSCPQLFSLRRPRGRLRAVEAMNIFKALATIVGTALAFGAAGMGLGVALGKVAPGFYRQTIAVRDPASFNPVELGLGLGLTNGLIWGLVIGLVVVAILAWKETRRPRRPGSAKPA
jgi:hypothetical protein